MIIDNAEKIIGGYKYQRGDLDIRGRLAVKRMRIDSKLYYLERNRKTLLEQRIMSDRLILELIRGFLIKRSMAETGISLEKCLDIYM